MRGSASTGQTLWLVAALATAEKKALRRSLGRANEVLIVADGNPNGGMVTFHFSPASGVAEANTRVRLAATQNITAVARMNDGSFFTATRQVKVTIGGCGG